ncbi:hypothetical protein [Sinorhizobium sp. Sb3]|nr:hypothetical protein [Sinorhizobium sp. Sb3]
MFTEILEVDSQLTADVLAHDAGDRDAAFPAFPNAPSSGASPRPQA